MQLFILFLALSAAQAADKLRVALVGALNIPAGPQYEMQTFTGTKEALAFKPQIMGVDKPMAEELKMVPVITFAPESPELAKIKNPNLILVKDVSQAMALALKVCDPSLFKSAMHVKACLRPHQESIYPQGKRP